MLFRSQMETRVCSVLEGYGPETFERQIEERLRQNGSKEAVALLEEAASAVSAACEFDGTSLAGDEDLNRSNPPVEGYAATKLLGMTLINFGEKLNELRVEELNSTDEARLEMSDLRDRSKRILVLDGKLKRTYPEGLERLQAAGIRKIGRAHV